MTQERLKYLLDYDPGTGTFTWRNPNRKASFAKALIGKTAGNYRPDGYARICLDGKLYYSHRLAWLWIHGEMPKFIDHIDGNPSDNRISNLRPATMSQNHANKRSMRDGYKGVYQTPSGKWRAQLKHDDRKMHGRIYNTEQEANSEYFMMAKSVFGEYAKG